MKALVLSGGSGTRLRPITHTSAKQLVPVANKPILFYVLESIAEAGITDVGIVVGHTAPEVQDAVGDGSAFGVDVTYIAQDEPLGLAHAVRISRDYLGDDDFVMFLGDNFIIDGVTGLVDRFRDERPDAQILLTRVPDPRAFGVAVLDEQGRVIGLEEKPEHPRSDLALAGVYFFTPLIHEAVWAVKPSWRGELEITDSIQHLIDTGADVRSHIIDGYWKDTGNVVDILEVNRIILESVETAIDGDVDADSEIIGRVVIEKGATVKGSRIVGPALIATGTEIRDSYVGPFTSVAENCRIHDSELEFSIMMRDSSLTGIRRIEASLIGRHVHGTAVPRVPNAHRLVLGDHSTFQISS
ncbi:glucose-1-phosphate thymidylyltransferase [Streptomyces sp. NPDC020965]|uniref:dTDP-glucose synthase n=1 Tax=Streptomyces halstedii TaxID=1944 RepID=Q76KZ8_STRHA|nr:dTDP-glucose synthase [Streptomyces halstedii]